MNALACGVRLLGGKGRWPHPGGGEPVGELTVDLDNQAVRHEHVENGDGSRIYDDHYQCGHQGDFERGREVVPDAR
jgi:hypothetical protein